MFSCAFKHGDILNTYNFFLIFLLKGWWYGDITVFGQPMLVFELEAKKLYLDMLVYIH